MRELKFRVWHKGENRWLDPYLEEDPMINLLGEVYMYERPPISGWTNKEYFNGNLVVQQYTGLKDKNGKEIYEGDIVHYKVDLGDRVSLYVNRYGVICFRELRFLIKYFTKIGEDYDIISLLEQYEVVGNIFENPELL